MKIEREELAIRGAQPQDARQLAAWWNDSAVMAHAGFPKGLGRTEEQVRAEIAGNETGPGQRCMIEIQGRAVGEMVFRFPEAGAAEVGIKICEPEFQNRGFGPRLLAMLMDSLFEGDAAGSRPPVEKILLSTDLENTRAQHVYEDKLGFCRVRVARACWIDQLGRPRDAVEYELSRTAWRLRKEERLKNV